MKKTHFSFLMALLVAVSQYIISYYDLIESPLVNALVLALIVIITTGLYKMYNQIKKRDSFK